MILLREAILKTTNTVFSRFVISFVAFFFMYFFACCNFCEEDTCHTHITCIFSFCALLVLIMITLRYYRSVRYWMKTYQQEQKNGGTRQFFRLRTLEDKLTIERFQTRSLGDFWDWDSRRILVGSCYILLCTQGECQYTFTSPDSHVHCHSPFSRSRDAKAALTWPANPHCCMFVFGFFLKKNSYSGGV